MPDGLWQSRLPRACSVCESYISVAPLSMGESGATLNDYCRLRLGAAEEVVLAVEHAEAGALAGVRGLVDLAGARVDRDVVDAAAIAPEDQVTGTRGRGRDPVGCGGLRCSRTRQVDADLAEDVLREARAVKAAGRHAAVDVEATGSGG